MKIFCNYVAKILGTVSSTKLLTIQVLDFNNACPKKRTRNNDILEPIRDEFKIWNQYLQDGLCFMFMHRS